MTSRFGMGHLIELENQFIIYGKAML
jgi:hypothetical protein